MAAPPAFAICSHPPQASGPPPRQRSTAAGPGRGSCVICMYGYQLKDGRGSIPRIWRVDEPVRPPYPLGGGGSQGSHQARQRAARPRGERHGDGNWPYAKAAVEAARDRRSLIVGIAHAKRVSSCGAPRSGTIVLGNYRRRPHFNTWNAEASWKTSAAAAAHMISALILLVGARVNGQVYMCVGVRTSWGGGEWREGDRACPLPSHHLRTCKEERRRPA